MHFASMDDVFCEPTVVVHSSQTDHTNIAIAVSKKSQLHRFGFPSLSNMKALLNIVDFDREFYLRGSRNRLICTRT